ncbi:MAG TPA: methyltransferase domain-containing protein [Dehalococcoidia bacterium]|nr:methyltransferase domain-containing protein [Dehalococcoidia bacterium]
MTSSPDRVIATVASYDAGSRAYADHSSDRTHLSRLHERFRDLLTPGACILELGCGPGHDAAALAALELEVTGLDPARGLLTEAKRYDAIRYRLVQGDARGLPFASGSFDGVWACASLLHVPKSDVATALAEAFRVLKEGGVLFTSMSEGEEDDAMPVESEGLERRFYYYHSAPAWLELLREADFGDIDQIVNRGSGNFNPASTGWIETYGRKP